MGLFLLIGNKSYSVPVTKNKTTTSTTATSTNAVNKLA